MIYAPLVYVAMMVQAGPVCAGVMTADDIVHVAPEKFDPEDEPKIMLNALPSIVDVRIQQAADDIVNHTGIKPNFTVASADVANALAYIGNGGTRLLLYNPTFMSNVHHRVCKDWGVAGIMAHEIGHHLQGHILKTAGADYRQLELEADDFAGFVMYRMGATLEEAQRAIANLAQDADTATHPGRAQRLAAIEAGWMRARDTTVHESFSDEQRVRRAERAKAQSGQP